MANRVSVMTKMLRLYKFTPLVLQASMSRKLFMIG